MKNLVIVILVVAAFATGCTHDPFQPIAGKGGNATLVVYPAHHGKASELDSMKVYVKYNTQDAPSNGVYDDSMACTFINAQYLCTFTGLKNGNYYIYGKGYDYEYATGVQGGLPHKITAQQSQNFYLPVSEKHN